MGPPGVGAGIADSGLSWVGEQSIKIPVGLVVGHQFGDSLAFGLRRTVHFQSFVMAGGEKVNYGFDYRMPRSSINQMVSSWEEMGYERSTQITRKAGRIIREHIGLEPEVRGSSYRRLNVITEEFTPRYIGYKGLAADLGIGLILDVGFQAYGDWNNPYLSPIQKWGRLGVAGGGSLTVTGVGLIIRGGLIAAGIGTGPAGWIALVVTLGVDFAWEQYKPTVFESLGFDAQRKLKPLGEN